MDLKHSRMRVLVLAATMGASLSVAAQDIRIPLPRRSKPTPVQRYNDEGVSALKKNKVEKAKAAFYKAYLLDPNDPFTLNNLGYVAELDGDADRALRYYDLAAANRSQAVVKRSTLKKVEGKPVAAVAGRTEQGPLQVNRMNVEAITLLEKDRALEAQRLLEKALALDAGNPFTLNNLGFALEKQGELEGAARYYDQAAAARSNEKVIVTVSGNRKWRGRPISEVAHKNAEKARDLLAHEQNDVAKAARLNLRGVSALNRNDRQAARTFFTEANQIDPGNAFTLNNMAYVAELDGDRETANALYAEAQRADDAARRIGVASRQEAVGRPLNAVADKSAVTVAQRMAVEQAQRRQQHPNEPVILKRRDGSVVETVTPPPAMPKPDQPQEEPQPPQEEPKN